MKIKMNNKIKIAPSLLSANFANLENDIRQCELGNCDILHLDIMDGHFVPNITFGTPVVKSIRKITKLPFDCHLMISNPDCFIEDFANAGADMISIHVENQIHTHRVISQIKNCGKKAGIVLNPATPINYAYEVLEFVDFILLMSVNPGFGGQELITSIFRRCESIANFIENHNLRNIEIEIDGGVKFDNAKSLIDAGANILVCGSGIFSGNIAENINTLRNSAEETIKG